MSELEKIIIAEMEKRYPNAVEDGAFWKRLEETYGEITLNDVVMDLYKRGVIGFMPYHTKNHPLADTESPYKIVLRAMTLKKR